jgi:molybdopterin converting factor subunit 1
MKIKVLFFASFREIVGSSSVELDVADGATTTAVFAGLCDQYPQFRLGTMAMAVNKAYISDEVRLKEGDELALLPPISGG